MYRVISYKEEGNLGNTVQTLGLSHLLSPSKGVWHCKIGQDPIDADDVLVINGWFGNYPKFKYSNDTIFCGFHLTGSEEDIEPSILSYLRENNRTVGTRDPDTADFLNSIGINAEFVGCGSLLFPKYEGPRSGIISVDYDGPGEHITHACDTTDSWEWKWNKTKDLINKYKTAEAVYTDRLHVALPCIAMGTPVFIQDNIDTRRFSILDSLNVEYNKLNTYDSEQLKNTYKLFLENELGTTLNYVEPTIPKINE